MLGYFKIIVVQILSYNGDHVVIDSDLTAWYNKAKFLIRHNITPEELNIEYEVIRYNPATNEYIIGT